MSTEPLGQLLLPRLAAILGGDILSCVRLPTGLCHQVYRVATRSETFIVRVAGESTRNYLQGTCYWLRRLAHLQLPIARVVHDGSEEEPPFQILTDLPGRDLGEVYTGLSESQKRHLAGHLMEVQQRVATLPQCNVYGYMFSYQQGDPAPDWETVIRRELQRLEDRCRQTHFPGSELIRQLHNRLADFRDYFSTIRPTAFLADATTKNVLIHDGAISGIVDLDEICFGDWLTSVALTHVSLRALGYDTIYTDEMQRLANLRPGQLKALFLYEALYAADLLSEDGIRFNRETVNVLPPQNRQRLMAVAQSSLGRISPNA